MKFTSLVCLALATITCVVAADPPKYIKVNGISKLNPEYTRWKESQGEQGTTLPNAGTALPVVSTMEDYFAHNEASEAAGLEPRPLAATTDQAVEELQKPETTAQVGLKPDELVDELQRILAKYEVPMGMMSKLLGLRDFDLLDFIVDDSGSMGADTDSFHPDSRPMTRWEEAISRIKAMFEIIAHIPIKAIRIRFLNRRDQLHFTRDGKAPNVFLTDAYAQIDRVASTLPSGGTPALAALEESYKYGRGKKVSRYFFGDGVPNSGEQPRIEQMIVNRPSPHLNPMTFLSCTNEDDQVEWMKELEERASYCAEYDDYNDEKDEILRDQGQALPFSKGFHLVGQLVAAFNPEDLDAMDESVPLTKYTLDQLLGLDHSVQDYMHYYKEFCKAQKIRQVATRMDQAKRDFPWDSLAEEFMGQQTTETIAAVAQFKDQLIAAAQGGPVRSGGMSGLTQKMAGFGF